LVTVPATHRLSVLTLLVAATNVVVFQANPAGADGPQQRLKPAVGLSALNSLPMLS